MKRSTARGTLQPSGRSFDVPIGETVSNLAVINVGPEVDIAETQSLLEGEIGVAGNIDHIGLLPTGTPEEVEKAVRTAIEASGGDPRFMVAPGCEITSDTPAEHVEAFARAAG